MRASSSRDRCPRPLALPELGTSFEPPSSSACPAGGDSELGLLEAQLGEHPSTVGRIAVVGLGCATTGGVPAGGRAFCARGSALEPPSCSLGFCLLLVRGTAGHRDLRV